MKITMWKKTKKSKVSLLITHLVHISKFIDLALGPYLCWNLLLIIFYFFTIIFLTGPGVPHNGGDINSFHSNRSSIQQQSSIPRPNPAGSNHIGQPTPTPGSSMVTDGHNPTVQIVNPMRKGMNVVTADANNSLFRRQDEIGTMEFC